MLKKLGIVAFGAALMVSTPALAQGLTGDELRGQTVDIRFADGTTNSVFFGSTGNARITNAAGQAANATWYAAGDQICLSTGNATECWAYASRFAAGQPVRLSSTCEVPSVWTARAVNPVMEIAPTSGERG